MRGPGETKLESDRRMVKNRISTLKAQLEEVKQHRAQQRAGRNRTPFPVVAIAGYTSAGKSTLMNRLCDTQLLADAMPFATLDPTTRKLELPGGYSVFLTDTVGFIRNLPTQLVAAFRSTLEEVTLADLILHVVDLSSEDWEAQRDTVVDTLRELGAQDIPTLTVFNKVDLLEDPSLARKLVADWEGSVAVSALDGTGIPDLLEMLSKKTHSRLGRVRARVPYDQSALVEACYRNGRVLSCEYEVEGILIEAELTTELRSRLAPYEVKPIPTS